MTSPQSSSINVDTGTTWPYRNARSTSSCLGLPAVGMIDSPRKVIEIGPNIRMSTDPSAVALSTSGGTTVWEPPMLPSPAERRSATFERVRRIIRFPQLLVGAGSHVVHNYPEHT